MTNFQREEARIVHESDAVKRYAKIQVECELWSEEQAADYVMKRLAALQKEWNALHDKLKE